MWETMFVEDLRRDLEDVVLHQGEDRWVWKLEEDGRFSVNSIYKKLESDFSVMEAPIESESLVFSQLWKSSPPSRAVAFSWRMLLDRIPTRLNLLRRLSIDLASSMNCVLCNSVGESSNHLFLHYVVSRTIWEELLRWLGFNFISPPNLFIHWACLFEGGGNRGLRRGFSLIWNATIWTIWRVRNDRIFNGSVKGVEEACGGD